VEKAQRSGMSVKRETPIRIMYLNDHPMSFLPFLFISIPPHMTVSEPRESFLWTIVSPSSITKRTKLIAVA